jgi:hypothetical protein
MSVLLKELGNILQNPGGALIRSGFAALIFDDAIKIKHWSAPVGEWTEHDRRLIFRPKPRLPYGKRLVASNAKEAEAKTLGLAAKLQDAGLVPRPQL